ncbi:MAG: type II secretion system protein [Bacilli bacterium]
MKKGFTLVELLAVLVILAIIATISFPIVSNVLEKSEKKAYDQQIKEFEKAAKNFETNNSNLLIQIDENDEIQNISCYISLDTLKAGGYLEDKEIINPMDDSSMDNAVIDLQYDAGSNQYKYVVHVDGNSNLTECEIVK